MLHGKPEANSDLIAAVCVTVDDGSSCDEVWYLTNDQDTILDAEQVLFVSTPEELQEELEVRFFCEEGLSRIDRSVIHKQRRYNQDTHQYDDGYHQYDDGYRDSHWAGQRGLKDSSLSVIKKGPVQGESEYMKRESLSYHEESNKLIFKVLTSPVINSTDVNIVTEAVKKYGTLNVSRKLYDFQQNYRQVGMTRYLGDDIKVVDYYTLVYIPGVKTKHERRLNTSRKRRKKVGKIPFQEVLLPFAKMVTTGLHKVVNKIIVKKSMVGCIELDISHPDLKSRKAAMQIIGDGFGTIRNLSNSKEYQAETCKLSGYWDGAQYKHEEKSFVDLIKECAPSVESLLKSKEAHEVTFARAIQIEYADLVRQGKIKEE